MGIGPAERHTVRSRSSLQRWLLERKRPGILPGLSQ